MILPSTCAMGTRNLRRDLKRLAIMPPRTDLLIKRCRISTHELRNSAGLLLLCAVASAHAEAFPLKSKLDDDFASWNRVVMLTSERDRHGYRHSEVVQFDERLRVHST